MRYKELEVKECFELRFVHLSCVCEGTFWAASFPGYHSRKKRTPRGPDPKTTYQS